MSDQRFTPYQAGTLLALNLSTQSYVFAPSIMAKEAGQDMWMSVALAAAAAMGMTVYLLWLAGRFPEQTVVQWAGKLLGKPLGAVVGIGYIAYFAILALIYVQLLAVSFKTLFLPNTPLLVLSVLAVLIGMYGAVQGIEVIARVSGMLVIFATTMLLASTISVLQHLSFDHYLPVGENPLSGILHSSLYPYAAYGQVAAILMIYPYIRQKGGDGKALRPVLWICLAIIGLTGITIVQEIGIFGPHQLQAFAYPSIEMVTLIEYAGFIERLESFLATVWAGTAFITVASLLSLAAIAWSHLAPGKTGRPFVRIVILGLLVLGLSLFYVNHLIRLLDFLLHWWVYISLVFQVFMPLLLGLVYIMRRKGLQS